MLSSKASVFSTYHSRLCVSKGRKWYKVCTYEEISNVPLVCDDAKYCDTLKLYVKGEVPGPKLKEVISPGKKSQLPERDKDLAEERTVIAEYYARNIFHSLNQDTTNIYS